MRKIKRDDTVLVMHGKDRGKTGVVRQVIGGGHLVKRKGERPKMKEDKVIVTGLNMFKRHQTAQQGTQQAGIIEKEVPMHISNVMLSARLQQAGARRIRRAWRRRKGPGVPQLRPGHRLDGAETERTLPERRSCRSCRREFGYANAMQVPRVQKVTVNIGLGEAKENARASRRRRPTSRRSPGRSRWSRGRRSRSRTSRSARACPSASW